MQSNVIKFRTIFNNHGKNFHLHSLRGPNENTLSPQLLWTQSASSQFEINHMPANQKHWWGKNTVADRYFLQTSSLRHINNIVAILCLIYSHLYAEQSMFHVPHTLGMHIIIVSNKHMQINTPWCCIPQRGDIISDARSERVHSGGRPALLILPRELSWIETCQIKLQLYEGTLTNNTKWILFLKFSQHNKTRVWPFRVFFFFFSSRLQKCRAGSAQSKLRTWIFIYLFIF